MRLRQRSNTGIMLVATIFFTVGCEDKKSQGSSATTVAGGGTSSATSQDPDLNRSGGTDQNDGDGGAKDESAGGSDPANKDEMCLTGRCELPETLEIAWASTLEIGDPSLGCTKPRDLAFFDTGTELRVFWTAVCNPPQVKRKLYSAALNPSNYAVIGSPQTEVNLGTTLDIPRAKVVKLDSNIFVAAWSDATGVLHWNTFDSALVGQASGQVTGTMPSTNLFDVVADGANGFVLARVKSDGASGVFLFSPSGQAKTAEVAVAPVSTSSGLTTIRLKLTAASTGIFLRSLGNYAQQAFLAKITRTGQVTCLRTNFSDTVFMFSNIFYKISSGNTVNVVKLDPATLQDTLDTTKITGNLTYANFKQLNASYVANYWYSDTSDVVNLGLDHFIPGSDYTPLQSPLAIGGVSGSPINSFDVGMLGDKLYVIYATDDDGVVIKVSDKNVPQ